MAAKACKVLWEPRAPAGSKPSKYSAGYPQQPQMVKRVAFKPEESVLTAEMGTCGAPNRLASVGRRRLLVTHKRWPPVPVMGRKLVCLYVEGDDHHTHVRTR